MDGAASAPEEDSGKIHIVALFPNPADMDSFTGKIASKMSEDELNELRAGMEANSDGAGGIAGRKFINYTARLRPTPALVYHPLNLRRGAFL